MESVQNLVPKLSKSGQSIYLERVLFPRFAVVRTEDHDLAFFAAERREMWDLDDDGTGEENQIS